MSHLTPTPVLYHVSRALSTAFECWYQLFLGCCERRCLVWT